MASFTENAIKRSFIRLLEKKPLKSITIRDIVDDCGINRSSFYYHFQDIPALLERIIQEGSDSIIRKNANGTIAECMEGVIRFLLRYKKSVLHVYKAVDREMFQEWVEHAHRRLYFPRVRFPSEVGQDGSRRERGGEFPASSRKNLRHTGPSAAPVLKI